MSQVKSDLKHNLFIYLENTKLWPKLCMIKIFSLCLRNVFKLQNINKRLKSAIISSLVGFNQQWMWLRCVVKRISSTLSIDDESGDLLRQRADKEAEEEREEGEDERNNEELLELPPDEIDEGLQRIGEPGEAGGGSTRELQETVNTSILCNIHL